MSTRRFLSFSEALIDLKSGDQISREGWNRKGMYLYLIDKHHPDIAPGYEPFIVMHTAQGTEQPGWLASQADLLANDWTSEEVD